MNTVLLSAIIILLIVCLVLLIRLGAKKDGSSNELLKQQIELSSKATDDKILRLSEQMNTLTDKNYKQQIELMKTLNDGTQKQMQMTAESLERMQQNNEKKREQMRKTLEEKLDELVAEYDFIIERRGLGLMQGLELSINPKDVIANALDNGLILFSAGTNVIRMVPPLVITKADVDEMITKLKKSF